MAIRTSIFPRTLQDAAVTSFLLCIIPVIYWFELFVVLPSFYVFGSLSYILHFVAGTFILSNVTSNFLAIILSDTSIKGRLLITEAGSKWKFCAVCESTVPPRSWHCNICNVCILKRDHHCIFTGCCIGHWNYRYFLMFLLYLFLATIYATYYNTHFILNFVEFRSWMSFVKIIFPLAMLFVELTPNQIYMILYLVVMLGLAFTGVLLYFHINLMLKGLVTHERNSKLNEYDIGVQGNIRVALGDRWYLVWLSPLLKSDLSHNGINWETRDSIKCK